VLLNDLIEMERPHIVEKTEAWRPHQSQAFPMTNGSDAPESYLQGLLELSIGYPAISGFLKRTGDSEPRKVVREEFKKRHRSLPGRCGLLTFHETSVEHHFFTTPAELAAYFDEHISEGGPRPCHLWVLEDLELAWVDVLGGRLGVDPLVFSEQTNTFNFTGTEHHSLGRDALLTSSKTHNLL
jgi:hypothetical protein